MRVRLKRGHRRNAILAPLVALTGCFGCAVAHASLYSQAAIDAAVALPLHRFVNTPGNELQNAPMEPCMAINFMAQVVHQDPAATNSAGDPVRPRLLAQLRNILIGGHEPNANGSLSG